MRDRVLGAESKTFHGFCREILEMAEIELKAITHIEAEDKLREIAIKEFSKGAPTDAKLRECLLKYSVLINRLKGSSKSISNCEDIEDDDIKELLIKYKKSFKKNQVDWDTYIKKVAYIIKNDKALQQKLQEKYQHVFIDEAHDVTKLLYSIIHVIKPKNLFIVGDPNQNIFEWKGAENLLLDLKFIEKYRGKTKHYSLKNNYRSNPSLISFFNAFIKGNPSLGTSEFKGIKTRDTVKPYVFIGKNKEKELEAIKFFCKKIVPNIKNKRDTAIIVKKHKTLHSIFKYLKKEKIEVKIKTSVDFKNSINGSFYLALIKTLDSTEKHKKAHLKLCIQFLIKGVGKKKIDKLFTEFKKNKNKISSTIKANKSRFSKDIQKSFILMFRLIRLLRKATGLLNTEKIKFILNTFEFENSLKAKEKNQLLVLYSELEKYKTFKGFLEQNEDGVKSNDENLTTLATIHSVKGQEFKLVCMAGCSDKEFLPPKNKMNKLEELRVALVGITRTKTFLFITATKSLLSFFRHTDPNSFEELKKKYK